MCVGVCKCVCVAEGSCPVSRGEVEPVSTEAVMEPQPAGGVPTFEVKLKQHKEKTSTTASPPWAVRSVRVCSHRPGNSSI